MSENLIQSGQLKLNAVNLRSSTGFVLDITPQTAEIVIHESLTEMFLSGEVTISENLSLIHISEPTRRTERSRMPSSA